MERIKIKCERLNGPGTNIEAIIAFDGLRDPVTIMCGRYDSDKHKCKMNYCENGEVKIKYELCIFTEWKNLRE